MRTTLGFISGLSVLCLIGCLPPREGGFDPGGGGAFDAPSPPSSPSSSPGPRGRGALASPLFGGGGDGGSEGQAPVAAGWTAEGDVALFDGTTGGILASSSGGGLGGERDLAFDPWFSRLLVFEGDAEGTWGEVASYPVLPGEAGPSLGERDHEVWIDGVARVAASPFGALVFEDGYGPRWRLVRADGQPSSSVFGPRPVSLATGPLSDGGFRAEALTYGIEDDAADIRVAQVGPTGIDVPVTVPLLVPPMSSPPTARWVESAGGGQLVDVESGEVWITTFAGSGWPSWMPVGLEPGVTGVEQVAPFPGGDRLALLTTGAFDLVVASIGPGGAPQCAAGLDLPGEAEKAPLFFARGLVPVSATRVLVATSTGVLAVTLSGDCPPALAIDPDFESDALKGPLDRLP